MFKILSNLLLLPIVKLLLEKYAKKTAQKVLIFNLPNFLIITGIFIMVTSVAALWLISAPFIGAFAIGVVQIAAPDKEKAVKAIAIMQKSEIEEGLGNYVIQEISTHSPHWTYSFIDAKLVTGVLVVSVFTLYSILVSNGYVIPLTKVIKNVLIGNEDLNGLKDNVISSTNFGSVADKISSISEPVTKVLSKPDNLAYWKYITTPLLVLGFGYTGRHIVTKTFSAINKVTDYYSTADVFVKGVIATAKVLKFVFTPIKYVTGFVFAFEFDFSDFNNNIVSENDEKVLRFKYLMDRYGHLLGLSVDEKIEGLKKIVEQEQAEELFKINANKFKK